LAILTVPGIKGCETLRHVILGLVRDLIDRAPNVAGNIQHGRGAAVSEREGARRCVNRKGHNRTPINRTLDRRSVAGEGRCFDALEPLAVAQGQRKAAQGELIGDHPGERARQALLKHRSALQGDGQAAGERACPLVEGRHVSRKRFVEDELAISVRDDGVEDTLKGPVLTHRAGNTFCLVFVLARAWALTVIREGNARQRP